MRIVTWNINGIRATGKRAIKPLLDSFDADVICLQETKITRNLLPDYIANVDGYFAFFSFSRLKGGYSGVVTYCKKKICPVNAVEGLTGILQNNQHDDMSLHEYTTEELKALDSEGRAVITTHQASKSTFITVVNVYCPRADADNVERYKFKMDFYNIMEIKCKQLLRSGHEVILVGDLNVSHRRIDHCDPDQEFEHSPARLWMDRFILRTSNEENTISGDASVNENSILVNEKSISVDTLVNESSNARGSFLSEDSANNKCTFIDCFRHFRPAQTNAFTCWNTKVRARETNYGTRIDYILASKNLHFKHFTSCMILSDVQGSDHCPVEGNFDITLLSSLSVPLLCAVYMPEIAGKQQTIKSYFNARTVVQKKRALSGEEKHSRNNNKRERKNITNYFNETKIERTPSKVINESEVIALKQETKSIIENNAEKKESSYSNKNLNENYMAERDSNITAGNKKEKSNLRSWKTLFKGPDIAPVCTGHQESSVLRTVKKEGANLGRQFYVCKRPKGHSNNKEASCNFFIWKN